MVIMVVIMRKNIHAHGSRDLVVLIPDVRLTTMSEARGVRDPDCFPTITTSRTPVPGRE